MPFSIYHDYQIVKERTNDYIKRNMRIEERVKVNNNKKQFYDKVVLIMGESVNKHHMNIYNYQKNTTPFFAKLKQQKQIFDAIAPATPTRFAIPISLTDANINNYHDEFLKSQSIVSDFVDNRYKTYWISNQGNTGLHDSAVASIANEADISIFKNFDFHHAKPDEVLLDVLDNKLIDKNANQMFIFHLMGSHGSYKERYTNLALLNDKPNNLIEEYDNTIYYTDYIIKNIFDKFKLLVIYTSDHGEVINIQGGGHGYFKPFKSDFDIPLVIYSSVQNSRIDELFNKNQKHYFNNTSLNDMIKYISYISDEHNISQSSIVFSQEPSNIYDYDLLNMDNE